MSLTQNEKKMYLHKHSFTSSKNNTTVICQHKLKTVKNKKKYHRVFKSATEYIITIPRDRVTAPTL